MNSDITATIYVVTSLLIIGIAVATLSPVSERTMVSEVVSEGDPPPGATVMNYSELPQPAQLAVDEVTQQGGTTLSTYDNYRAVETLQGDRYILKDDSVFYIRTTSADDSGGLFEGLARDSLLAIGGILIGTGIFRRDQRGNLLTVISLPAGAIATLLSVNALEAPTLSVISWAGTISFGLAAGVPVLTGIALQQRDYYIGVIALATFLLSVAVLFSGNALSALYLIAPLIMLGLPGVGFGWWVGKQDAEKS
ncbi:hypothetical protein [Haloarcula argentinensis]|uniref:Uncharacterized protein n=1 Tax=Haloarcula argentinensis TaxID=43776 RepID=A0A830FRW8_HALAR|nr:hypothetical protein [Haloarcula argentinensis]MDS0255796.1 hypothetical protein [Haloarcula argentinensis]GGM51418.1 hypothetical protein GCM10009006_35760 [Haloarcula argentinensis]